MGALRRFLETESAGAKLLGVATIVAVVWANSSLSSSYDALWRTTLPDLLSFDGRVGDLRHVVNEALMAVFFFVVGLEIKRELVAGELNTRRVAALPIVAALGGMVVPALIYIALNAGTPTAHGWGVPIATDIAFAVAVISLFSARVPAALKVFLLSLAIVDDIGAIIVIALFYAGTLSFAWLVVAGMTALGLWWAATNRNARWWIFLPGGLALWASVLFAGIHPTIAGVALAGIIPIGRENDGRSLEDRLHPWSSLAIVPLFALVNAGVTIDGAALRASVTSRVGLGVVLGLVIGKIAGILLFSWAAVRTRFARLPPEVSWSHMAGAAAAAGIGFTVSIFITDLAFEDPAISETVRLAVFVGSLVAAMLAIAILARATSPD